MISLFRIRIAVLAAACAVLAQWVLGLDIDVKVSGVLLETSDCFNVNKRCYDYRITNDSGKTVLIREVETGHATQLPDGQSIYASNGKKREIVYAFVSLRVEKTKSITIDFLKPDTRWIIHQCFVVLDDACGFTIQTKKGVDLDWHDWETIECSDICNLFECPKRDRYNFKKLLWKKTETYKRTVDGRIYLDGVETEGDVSGFMFFRLVKKNESTIPEVVIEEK